MSFSKNETYLIWSRYVQVNNPKEQPIFSMCPHCGRYEPFISSYDRYDYLGNIATKVV